MKSKILQIAITKSAQLISLFILSTSVSMAAVTYTYIGNNYNLFNPIPSSNIYNTSMHVELSFTTDSLLTNFAGDAIALVTSFSYFDGLTLLTESNGKLSTVDLNTDSSGNINQWNITGHAFPVSLLENVGDIHHAMNTRHIIGSETEDNVWTTECISKPFGSCVRADNRALNRNFQGTWSVSPSAVPIPASVWLFGSGLLGLIGIARRKTA